MILRKARMDDADLLLIWRNDPEVRAMSEHTGRIRAATHRAWLARQLAYSQCHGSLWVAQHDDTDVGYGRVQGVRRVAQLSYCIAAEYRGRGLGLGLVRLLVARARAIGYRQIGLRVRRANVASVLCALRGGVTMMEIF